jgi:tetratricopeptide (TPR) repeat protein
VLAAERGRYDAGLARAWLERAAVAGERRDGRAALGHVEHADAIVARLGKPALLEAASLHLRGAALAERGDAAGAERALDAALERREKALGAVHVDVGRTLVALGNVQRSGAAPRLDAARVSFERARAIFEQELGTAHVLLGECDHNLAGVERVAGKLEAARARYERALEVEKKALGEKNPAVARTTNSIGLVLVELGDAKGALARFDEASAIFRELGLSELASSLHNAGLALASLGRFGEARARWDEALALPNVAGVRREDLVRARGENAAPIPPAIPVPPPKSRPPEEKSSPVAKPAAAPMPAKPREGSYLPAPAW